MSVNLLSVYVFTAILQIGILCGGSAGDQSVRVTLKGILFAVGD